MRVKNDVVPLLDGETWETWKEHAARGDCADAVVSYIRLYDWVTFIELAKRFAPYITTEGDFEMTFGNDENLIIWSRMSQEFLALILRLLDEKRVFMHPSSRLTYMIDGRTLVLPTAERPPKGGYKTPHWLPICLRVVPLQSPKQRRPAP